MLKTVNIPLDPPLNGPSGPVSEIVIREPRFGEVLEHGEPYVISRSPEGIPLFVENAEALQAYVAACVVSPDVSVLHGAGVKVARAVKETVLGFFLPDTAEGDGSTISPTS